MPFRNLRPSKRSPIGSAAFAACPRPANYTSPGSIVLAAGLQSSNDLPAAAVVRINLDEQQPGRPADKIGITAQFPVPASLMAKRREYGAGTGRVRFNGGDSNRADCGDFHDFLEMTDTPRREATDFNLLAAQSLCKAPACRSQVNARRS